MAITDIAEALTATDRPYKKAMPLENVYRILRIMVNDNELDHDLVEFFINEKIYEQYLTKHESTDKGTSKNWRKGFEELMLGDLLSPVLQPNSHIISF